MYAFKIVVTTIFFISMFMFAYAGIKINGKGKKAAVCMLIVEALGIIAIWG